MKLERFIRIVKSFIPSKLPVGVTEFHAWADDVIDLAGAPNNDSVRFSLATMIPHANAQDAYKPKRYFILTLIKAMANQVAYSVVQDLKAKQLAEAEAARKAEATAIPVESVNVEQTK